MKQVKNVLTLMVLLIALSARADGERKTLLFNFDWKFKLGEVQNAESPTFDDADWRQLDLPHDFQIEMPWNEKSNRSRGFKDMATGWYRKTFDADKTWQGKRVILDFEGIMLHGDAYLNGQKIGGTDYGYLMVNGASSTPFIPIPMATRWNSSSMAKAWVETAGQPTRLVIETENPDWRADGMDLQYVKVRAVDKKGRVVPTNDYKETFQVEGPARMIAVDNGDHSSNDLFDGNEKQLYEGFAMAIARSSKDMPGKVKVTVNCKGLKGAAKTVMTK